MKVYKVKYTVTTVYEEIVKVEGPQFALGEVTENGLKIQSSKELTGLEEITGSELKTFMFNQMLNEMREVREEQND